ncbi:hypothetical protein [Alkalicoccus halolimnae]|uniref:PepSY domain-containing protein n=1 Tax=Alkalicoccus halolimnae TaxID=1667239 RepID=A0A5C7FGZ9_9BACI|nr:hypothetical protein [Alkalicoccus halolimnae]TXF85554.1 hypothetical protein FTX54_08160 [Alkalicoccus halolimnae]
MEAGEDVLEKVQMLGSGELIREEELASCIYKSLKMTDKWRREVNAASIKKQMIEAEFIFHPMWIVKTLVIAERRPFPSKVMPNMLFIDSVSGYRGLFSKVPEMKGTDAESAQLRKPAISRQEAVDKYVPDIQQKQINRSYILKKPKHELEKIELVYLPLWKVKVRFDGSVKTYYINANTGESEALVSELWNTREWILPS